MMSDTVNYDVVKQWTADQFEEVNKRLGVVQDLGVQQAVTQERLLALMEKLTKTVDEVDDLKEQLARMQLEVSQNSATTKILHKIVWVVVISVIGVVTKLLLGDIQ